MRLDRRRAQSGATLVELMVSITIIGFALAIVIGTFSTGLLDSTLAKRNTAAEAVMQYELEKVTFGGTPWAECFTSDSQVTPDPDPACPTDRTYTLRADVSCTDCTSSPTVQTWMVSVSAWPGGGGPLVPSVSVIKARR